MKYPVFKHTKASVCLFDRTIVTEADINESFKINQALIYMQHSIEEILSRIREREGARTKRELAEILHISPQDFSQREKRGTLLPLLVEWAMQRNISLDWLVSGRKMKDDEAFLADSESSGYKIRVKSPVRTQSDDPEKGKHCPADCREEGLHLLSEILTSGNEAIIQLALTQLRAIADFLRQRQ